MKHYAKCSLCGDVLKRGVGREDETLRDHLATKHLGETRTPREVFETVEGSQ